MKFIFLILMLMFSNVAIAGEIVQPEHSNPPETKLLFAANGDEYAERSWRSVESLDALKKEQFQAIVDINPKSINIKMVFKSRSGDWVKDREYIFNREGIITEISEMHKTFNGYDFENDASLPPGPYVIERKVIFDDETSTVSDERFAYVVSSDKRIDPKFLQYVDIEMEKQLSEIPFYALIQSKLKKTDRDNANNRLSDPDPNAWQDLSMEVVISDFQKSDGIFSSFICDELVQRLRSAPLPSLEALNEIDKSSRVYAFKNCLSPETDDFSELLKSVTAYSDSYPEVVQEMADAVDLSEANTVPDYQQHFDQSVQLCVQYLFPNSAARPVGFDLNAHLESLRSTLKEHAQYFSSEDGRAFLKKTARAAPDDESKACASLLLELSSL